MTSEDILKLAQQANLYMTSDERIAAVERFATLVAAAEREECAKVIEAQDVDPSFKGRLAIAIRARGEK